MVQGKLGTQGPHHQSPRQSCRRLWCEPYPQAWSASAKDSAAPSWSQFSLFGLGAACTETAAKATEPAIAATITRISASNGDVGGSVHSYD